MMWKGWDEREKCENAALDFWEACKRADARLASTEYLWRRPGSPTMEERRGRSDRA
jgi:hypothetical protein